MWGAQRAGRRQNINATRQTHLPAAHLLTYVIQIQAEGGVQEGRGWWGRRSSRKLPGSFQTHFPMLRPINQAYICVGWTSTPRGGVVEGRRCVCMCARYLGECAVCVLDGWVGGREGGLCALCAFAGKDGSCLLMLGLFQPRSHRDNHGTSLICFFLLHIVLLVSVSTNPLPDPSYPPNACTHIHTTLCFAGPRWERDRFSAPVPLSACMFTS